MRVISGVRKGHPLKAVPGTSTRPTTDKVKEAIFNIIGPYFQGGLALDLYGGSGGLGIEALSRGIEKVIFVDHEKKAIDTINQNLKSCRFLEIAEVYRNDSKRALKALSKRELRFSYIFLDPPYAKQRMKEEIEWMDTNHLLEESGKIVCEYAKDVNLPEVIGSLTALRVESYGDTTIAIYGYNNNFE